MSDGKSSRIQRPLAGSFNGSSSARAPVLPGSIPRIRNYLLLILGRLLSLLGKNDLVFSLNRENRVSQKAKYIMADQARSLRQAPPLPEKMADWVRVIKAERSFNDLVEDIHRQLVEDAKLG